MLIDACWSCRVGLHAECYDPDWLDAGDIDCCCSRVEPLPAAVEKGSPGRPMLDPADITDIKSTGRKRAAMVAPIFTGMLCEWSGLRYAGGGVIPIVGCRGTEISDNKGKGDRHHGPDKNVLNNSVGINLHRICPNCHHRWHALNDPYYAAERPEAEEQYLPLPEHVSYAHDPLTLASEEEIELSEAHWATRSEKRGEYPFPAPEDVVR